MVKETHWNEIANCYQTRFSKMYDVYGMTEDLLFPVKLNVPEGERSQETSLATYLVKIKEFQTLNVTIKEYSTNNQKGCLTTKI